MVDGGAACGLQLSPCGGMDGCFLSSFLSFQSTVVISSPLVAEKQRANAQV